jgi:hypothetical protein
MDIEQTRVQKNVTITIWVFLGANISRNAFQWIIVDVTVNVNSLKP